MRNSYYCYLIGHYDIFAWIMMETITSCGDIRLGSKELSSDFEWNSGKVHIPFSCKYGWQYLILSMLH